MVLLAVYGTLKKGRGNHHYLKGATYLFDGITEDKYAVVKAGFPMVFKPELLYFPTTTYPLEVEVYEVSEETLKRIDRLESHPEFYKRQEVWVSQHGVEQMCDETHLVNMYITNPEFTCSVSWEKQGVHSVSPEKLIYSF